MKVENLTSPNGNKVPNQFVIDKLGEYSFQSYNSEIAYYDGTILKLYNTMWDYSATTRKYFKQFINEYTSFTYENKAQWEKEIKENDLIEVI